MTITYELFVTALGLVVLVGGAIGVIYKAVNKVLEPYREIGMKFKDMDKKINDCVDKLDQHDEDIKEIKEHIDADKNVHKLQNKALLNIINHLIDGNNVKDMKKTRDEIIDFISED